MATKYLSEIFGGSQLRPRYPFTVAGAARTGRRAAKSPIAPVFACGTTSGIATVNGSCASPSLIVCVGLANTGIATSTCVTSSDGVTWTNRTLSLSASWVDVIWTGTRFLASNTSTTSNVSTDGVTWSAGPAMPAASLRFILFKGGLYGFPEGGGGSYYYSADNGATWATRAAPASIAATMVRTALAANASTLFVAATTAAVYRTTDGTNWTLCTLPARMTGCNVIATTDTLTLFLFQQTGPLLAARSTDSGVTIGAPNVVMSDMQAGGSAVSRASTAGPKPFGTADYVIGLSRGGAFVGSRIVLPVMLTENYDSTASYTGWVLHTSDGLHFHADGPISAPSIAGQQVHTLNGPAAGEVTVIMAGLGAALVGGTKLNPSYEDVIYAG